MGVYVATYRSLKERRADVICCDATFDFKETDLVRKLMLAGKGDSFSTTKVSAYGRFDVLSIADLYTDPEQLAQLLAATAPYDSVEVILDETEEKVRFVVDGLIPYLRELELSIGFLLPSVESIEKHRAYFEERGIYVCSGHEVKLSPKRAKPLKPSLSSGPSSFACMSAFRVEPQSHYLDIIRGEPFRKKLMRYIQRSNKTNVEIYTSGGITRQVFSKIISKDDYLPKKETIICLVIGMELDLDDALDLLSSAGYTLSDSLTCDCVVKNAIEEGRYDLDEINAELDFYREPILGWKPRED